MMEQAMATRNAISFGPFGLDASRRPLVRARTTPMNDRRNSESKGILAFGPFSLFAAERLLKKGNEPIPLGGRALAGNQQLRSGAIDGHFRRGRSRQ